jgi:hypothetical protein
VKQLDDRRGCARVQVSIEVVGERGGWSLPAVQQEMASERRPGEVWNRRIGEATGVIVNPRAELCEGGGRHRDSRPVVCEDELGLFVGRLETVGGRAEVVLDRDGIEILQVGQCLDEGSPEDAGLLCGAEVRAVDPHEIDRAAAQSRRFFSDQFADQIGSVPERHDGQGDLEILAQCVSHRALVKAVAGFVPSPHRVAHRRPARPAGHLAPCHPSEMGRWKHVGRPGGAARNRHEC